MEAGNTYTNVHTVHHPAGEVRGQNFATRTFRSNLTGHQEVSPKKTPTDGQAVFQLSRDGTKLYYTLEVSNIHDVVVHVTFLNYFYGSSAIYVVEGLKVGFDCGAGILSSAGPNLGLSRIQYSRPQ